MEAFVVRIWQPGKDEPASSSPLALHGVVEHVRTAQSRPFRNERQLLRLLRSGLHQAQASTAPPATPTPKGRQLR